jgi:hypothetical protein
MIEHYKHKQIAGVYTYALKEAYPKKSSRFCIPGIKELGSPCFYFDYLEKLDVNPGLDPRIRSDPRLLAYLDMYRRRYREVAGIVIYTEESVNPDLVSFIERAGKECIDHDSVRKNVKHVTESTNALFQEMKTRLSTHCLLTEAQELTNSLIVSNVGTKDEPIVRRLLQLLTDVSSRV